MAAGVEGERGDARRRGSRARSRSGSPSPSLPRAGSPRPRRARRRAGTARRRARPGCRARAAWAWGAASLLHNRRSTMSALAVSHVYPLGSRLNERGRLEIGGCDVVELAREFGTPAYVYAEDDMRARARSFTEAFRARTRALRGGLREQGVPLHRRVPAVRRGGAVGRRRLGRRAAPRARGGDATRSGSTCTATTSRPPSWTTRSRAGVGHIVVDSFDEIERLSGRAPARAAARHARHRAEHPRVHPDRPGGLEVRLPARRRCRAGGRGLRRRRARAARAARAHRLADLRRWTCSRGSARCSPAWATIRCSTSAAGSGIAYTRRGHARRSVEEYVEALLRHAPDGVTVLCEPGRSLVGQRRRDALHGRAPSSAIPDVRTYVVGGRRDVRQPAPDALRRALRGRDRRPLRRRESSARSPACTASRATCSCATSQLDDPRPGDVLVIPATGAYGHAMANNYNAVPAAAGDLLPGRRRARGRAPRDLRRPDAA